MVSLVILQLLLGVASLAGWVSAAAVATAATVATAQPPGATAKASIRYSTSTLIFTTTITTDTTTFTFSSTSTVTETYEGDAYLYTSTLEIPASTETSATKTLFTAVSEVSGGLTIISDIPTTDYTTKLQGHVVTSLDSTLPHDTAYSSVLVTRASELVSTEQVVHTSVEYGTLTSTVFVAAGAAGAAGTIGAIGAADYQIFSTSTKTVVPTSTVETSVPVWAKTTVTKQYETTILSQPYTTETYKPSQIYHNGTHTAPQTETVVVWQSCYIVTQTTATIEADVLTYSKTTLNPKTTYTLVEPVASVLVELVASAPPGSASSLSAAPGAVSPTIALDSYVPTLISYPLTTHTVTEFVPHTFTTINTYYVTTPVKTDYTDSTLLSTATVTSVETDVYDYETIEISGGSTFLTTVPVDTQYTHIFISAHKTVVSGIAEETETTTYTQGNPVSYLVSSYVFTTTETYEYTIPVSTASDSGDSIDSGDSGDSFTLLSFNSESSHQQNVPSILTIILTLACVVMLPLVL